MILIEDPCFVTHQRDPRNIGTRVEEEHLQLFFVAFHPRGTAGSGSMVPDQIMLTANGIKGVEKGIVKAGRVKPMFTIVVVHGACFRGFQCPGDPAS